ncbi:MAG: CDP-alcohol phosphatidyltransferase family protein [Acidimicrobiia bacterium]
MLDGRWRAKAERALDPVGQRLTRAGINANWLTFLGLLCAVAAALFVATGHLVLGVIGLVATGVPDLLDGSVARHSGTAGPRGAFLDSVADRVSDGVLLGGVAWYLAGESRYLPVLALAVLGLSLLVSYERAKAESLGFSARGGLMERAERLVLLGVGLAFASLLLVPVLWFMLVATALTAAWRFFTVWRQASGLPASPSVPFTRHRRDGDGEPRRFPRWWTARSPAGEGRRGRRDARDRPRTRP